MTQDEREARMAQVKERIDVLFARNTITGLAEAIQKHLGHPMPDDPLDTFKYFDAAYLALEAILDDTTKKRWRRGLRQYDVDVRKPI